MKFIRFLFILTVASLYSCIGVDEVDLSSTLNQKIELDSITKNISSELTLNEARYLKAVYYNVHAQEEGVNLTWVSSDETVLQIDQDSLRAIGVGQAFVYAMYDGIVSDSTDTITVSAISISIDETNIINGETKQLTIELAESLKNSTIVWTSSDESVATIDNNGNITTLKEGTTTISVTVDGIESNAITITIVESFFISITNLELTVGSVEQANITVDKTLENETVVWESSDENVATIDSDGKITAKAAGTTTITGKINSNVSNSITITVTELPYRTAVFTTTTSYKTEGTAILQQTADNKLELVFQDDADIHNGPSLYLLLANKTNPPFTIKTDGSSLAIDNTSAQLTANRLQTAITGKTTFTVPDGIDIDDYKYIVFYCTLGPVFGSAELK